jgi:hypothetical protein
MMNEKICQRVIFNHRANVSKIIVPNYKPRGWWECDIWQVSKALRSHEYEIKLTVSDFDADAKKQRKQNFGRTPTTKHEILASNPKRGPNRFSFAMPPELAEKVEIPEWAGLITVEGFAINIIKRAPVRHKRVVTEPELNKAFVATYYRYWNDKNDRNN